MNTQNKHAHVRIRTCIDNDQSESGCVPGQRATMHYQGRGLVHSNEYKICHSYHQTRWRTTNSMHDISFKSIFILKEIYLMSGPHRSPIYFAWINPNNSIIWYYGFDFLLISKHLKKKNEKCKNKTHRERKMVANIYWKVGF